MADTNFGVNHPLARKHWSRDLMKEALKRTSYAQFLGKSTNSLCQIKTETSKEAGDKITFGIRYQLQGDGRIGDEVLEGNEESLSLYSDAVLINQTRHAVKSAGKMSEQRVDFSVREEARDGLADWYANVMDTAFFNQLAGGMSETRPSWYGHNTLVAPDSDHIIYAGSSSEVSLSATTTCNMSLTLIDYCVEKAQTLKCALRPISVGKGDNMYVMFLHPYQVTQLRTNTNTGQWVDIQKAAIMGGQTSDNPIFSGALGVYNQTVLHSNTRIPQGLVTSTAGKYSRRAVFAGAQAMVAAFGQGYADGGFNWHEVLFDYENALGVGASSIWGLKRTMFNTSAVGAITVATWAQPSA